MQVALMQVALMQGHQSVVLMILMLVCVMNRIMILRAWEEEA